MDSYLCRLPMVIAFLNISTSELVIVLLVVLLLFGPQKLPEIIRVAGKLINDIRRASDDVKREITKASSGFDKEVKEAAEEIRREASKVQKQVMEAVPRPSIRTFERSVAGEAPKREDPKDQDDEKADEGKDNTPEKPADQGVKD